MSLSEQDRKVLIFALKSLNAAKQLIHAVLDKHDKRCEDVSKVVPVGRAMRSPERMLD